MAVNVYRGWRFVHPDFDIVEEAVGLQISDRGGIEMVEENACVRQAILMLLSTMTGERIMRLDYGCDLHKLVFELNDDTTAGLAIHYVRRALARWEPRIDVLCIDAERNADDPARMDILLQYRVRRTQRSDQLVFPFYLSPGES